MAIYKDTGSRHLRIDSHTINFTDAVNYKRKITNTAYSFGFEDSWEIEEGRAEDFLNEMIDMLKQYYKGEIIKGEPSKFMKLASKVGEKMM